MDENKLKADIIEVLRQHAKPRDEIPEAVREYMTEERMDEMIDALTKVIAEHAKREQAEP